MAGHSHWAGIKHKKGRQDKLRSKIFSKISRERLTFVETKLNLSPVYKMLQQRVFDFPFDP